MSQATPAAAESRKAGRGKFELDERLAAYKGVWVFIEHERGAVHPVSFELLGEGRKLADQLGVDLAGVVLGAPGEAVPRRSSMARTSAIWWRIRCWPITATSPTPGR